MLLAVAFLSLFLTAVDPYEPNDDPTRAPLVSDDASVEAWISPAEDVDWYQVVISEPGLVQAQLTSLPGNYDLYIYWFDPATSALFSVGGSAEAGRADESIAFAATKTGSYFVSVQGVSGASDSVDSYHLSLARSENPTPTVDASWGVIKSIFRTATR